jgi:ribosomal protein S11
LQTFSYAAGQVGISQEELETGIQKLTISMGKAQLGAKAQAKAFNAIGISVDDLKGKDTGEVFRMIADKLPTVNRSLAARGC